MLGAIRSQVVRPAASATSVSGLSAGTPVRPASECRAASRPYAPWRPEPYAGDRTAAVRSVRNTVSGVAGCGAAGPPPPAMRSAAAAPEPPGSPRPGPDPGSRTAGTRSSSRGLSGPGPAARARRTSPRTAPSFSRESAPRAREAISAPNAPAHPQWPAETRERISLPRAEMSAGPAEDRPASGTVPYPPRGTPFPLVRRRPGGAGAAVPGGRQTSRAVRRVLSPGRLAAAGETAIHLGPALLPASCGLPANSGEQPSNVRAGPSRFRHGPS